MNEPLLGSAIGVGIASIGVIALCFPLAVTKAVFAWPKFVFSRLLVNAVPPQAQEVLRLLYTSPEKYKKKYAYQLWVMRITGIIAILIGIFGILISVS